MKLFPETKVYEFSNNYKIEVLNSIIRFLFGDKKQQGKKSIDMISDYKYIHASFFSKGINLFTSDISYFEFLWFLEDMLLEGKSGIAKIVEIRNKEIPIQTKHNAKEIASLKRAKQYYAIKEKGNEVKESNESLRKLTMFLGAIKNGR